MVSAMLQLLHERLLLSQQVLLLQLALHGQYSHEKLALCKHSASLQSLNACCREQCAKKNGQLSKQRGTTWTTCV
jgi:hypothetical protein